MSADDDLLTAIRAAVRAEVQREVAPLHEQLAAMKQALQVQSERPSTETVPDELILVGEAAKLAKKHPRTIRRWIHQRGIGQPTEAGQLMVSKRNLQDFLRNRRRRSVT